MPKTIKQQYMQERRRIQNFLRRAEKRGFDFDFDLPDIPKKPSRAAVEKLKKLKPNNLYEKAAYRTPYGEEITGTERRKQERSEASRRAAQTVKRRREIAQEPIRIEDAILRNVEEILSNFNPYTEFIFSPSLQKAKVNTASTIESMLNGAIRMYGREEVAKRLQYSATEFNNAIESALYSSGSTYSRNADVNLLTIRAILTGENLMGKNLNENMESAYTEMDEEDFDE